MSTSTYVEPTVVADGFLAIAFRRLREGLLPHMRMVLGDGFEIGQGPNRSPVRLDQPDDDHDLYYLLEAWLEKQDKFMESFGQGGKDYIHGRNRPDELREFRSEQWAHQGVYTDEDASHILNITQSMLEAVGAESQARTVQQMAEALHQRTFGYDESSECFLITDQLSIADIDAGQVLPPYRGEPSVFAEGFLARAWRRLGAGARPYVENVIGRSLGDEPRDVSQVLDPRHFKRVDKSLERTFSTLQQQRNNWAHQKAYGKSIVLSTLGDIRRVLQSEPVSANALAQEVRQMLVALANLDQHLGRRDDVPSSHVVDDATILLQFVPWPWQAEWSPTPNAFDTRSLPAERDFGGNFRRPIPTGSLAGSDDPLAPRFTDTAEDYFQRGEWQNAIDAYTAAIDRDPEDAYAYLRRGRARGQLDDMVGAAEDFADVQRLNPDIESNINEADRFYRRGVAALNDRQIDESIDNFTRSVELNPHNARAYYNRGVAYASQEDYNLAAGDFNEAIRLHPQFNAAHTNLGTVYAAMEEYDRAIANYDEAIRLDPQSALAHINRGAAYGGQGEYDRAIADFDEAIRLDPQSALAHAARGAAYGGQGEYDRAIADFDEAIRLDPQSALAHTDRGFAYAGQGEYDRAIANYDEAIRLDPQSALAHINRGAAYGGQGEYDRAIADFDEAIRLDPQSALAHAARGAAYGGQGEYDRAIADFDEAIRLDPQSALAHTDRGFAYAGQGEYDRAIANYDEAIRLDPQSALAHINRGAAYAGQGEYDRAIANYDEAIRLDPQSALAHTKRGAAYADQGEYDRAIANFDEAIRLDPQDAHAYYNRGVVHYGADEFGLAIADMDDAIRLEPDNDMLQMFRAARDEIDRMAEQRADLDLEVSENPDDPDVWHLRGISYFDREEYQRAVDDFTAALELAPDTADILYDRGQAWEMLGDAERAMTDYGHAVIGKPDFAEAYYALGLIRFRQGDIQQAIADLTLAITYRSDYALAYQRRGICHLRFEDREQAQADFRMAREMGYNP